MESCLNSKSIVTCFALECQRLHLRHATTRCNSHQSDVNEDKVRCQVGLKWELFRQETSCLAFMCLGQHSSFFALSFPNKHRSRTEDIPYQIREITK